MTLIRRKFMNMLLALWACSLVVTLVLSVGAAHADDVARGGNKAESCAVDLAS